MANHPQPLTPAQLRFLTDNLLNNHLDRFLDRTLDSAIDRALVRARDLSRKLSLGRDLAPALANARAPVKVRGTSRASTRARFQALVRSRDLDCAIDCARGLQLVLLRDPTLTRAVSVNLGSDLVQAIESARSSDHFLRLARDTARDVAFGIGNVMGGSPPPRLNPGEYIGANDASGAEFRDRRDGTSLSGDKGHVLPGAASLRELADWLASITYGYVGLAVPADSDLNDRGNTEQSNADDTTRAPAPVGAVTIANLTIVSFLDDANAFDDAFHETEQLLSALARVAHDPNTPKAIADMATRHGSDGRALMFGPDDEPRELPPAPRTMYGWIIDALELVHAVDPPTGAAAQLLAAVTATPDSEPRGLQQGLEYVAATSYRQEVRARIRDGSLAGFEELAKRVVAVGTPAGLALFAASLYDTTQGWPWLGAGIRALIRLVQAVQ